LENRCKNQSVSRDRKTAEVVGHRRGPGIILRILSKDMEKAGHQFYLSDNGVWLADQVPPEYLIPVLEKG
jgi:putative RNA 2'-phosphotransferase